MTAVPATLLEFVSIKCVDTRKGLRTVPGPGENSVSMERYYSSRERVPKGSACQQLGQDPQSPMVTASLVVESHQKNNQGLRSVDGSIMTHSAWGVATVLGNLPHTEVFSEDTTPEPLSLWQDWRPGDRDGGMVSPV